MPISEEKALEILTELIKKPESQAVDIPRIWSELIDLYNKQFAPPVEEPKKKKRRRPGGPVTGWPAGVGRAEYTAWKNVQSAKGITENLNPQEYKRLRDAGLVDTAALAKAAPKAAVKAEAKPEAKAEAKAERAEKVEPKAEAKPKAAKAAAGGEKKPAARAKK